MRRISLIALVAMGVSCGKQVTYDVPEVPGVQCVTACEGPDSFVPPSTPATVQPKMLEVFIDIDPTLNACAKVKAQSTQGWQSLGCTYGPYPIVEFESNLLESGDCRVVQWRIVSGGGPRCFSVEATDGTVLELTDLGTGRIQVCIP